MEILKIGGIEAEVTFKSIKNTHLSVHPPDGRVTVSAPEHLTLDMIRVFLLTKLSWIRREQKKMREQQREAIKMYVNRESHLLFGKRYLLHVTVQSQRKSTVLVHHNKIELKVPTGLDPTYPEKVLYRWYREQLHNKISALISAWSSKMELEVRDFTIMKIKTKWGSCSTKGKLNFNIELVKKPEECIEYIVVHELVHLIERHHNKAFVTLMNHYLPNWQLRKRQLNELPIMG